MNRGDEEYGRANPAAAPELSRFAFLIGTWRCEAKLKRADGAWDTLQATWVGRYALDGYAIVDEYRMTGPTGQLLVLGMNVRVYDVEKKTWRMKWLNALGGTWVDLGPEDLGGVRMDEKSITYGFGEPVGAHALTRATYLNLTDNHFTWLGERSNDGTAWEEFLVIEAFRTKRRPKS